MLPYVCFWVLLVSFNDNVSSGFYAGNIIMRNHSPGKTSSNILLWVTSERSGFRKHFGKVRNSGRLFHARDPAANHCTTSHMKDPDASTIFSDITSGTHIECPPSTEGLESMSAEELAWAADHSGRIARLALHALEDPTSPRVMHFGISNETGSHGHKSHTYLVQQIVELIGEVCLLLGLIFNGALLVRTVETQFLEVISAAETRLTNLENLRSAECTTNKETTESALTLLQDDDDLPSASVSFASRPSVSSTHLSVSQHLQCYRNSVTNHISVSGAVTRAIETFRASKPGTDKDEMNAFAANVHISENSGCQNSGVVLGDLKTFCPVTGESKETRKWVNVEQAHLGSVSCGSINNLSHVASREDQSFRPSQQATNSHGGESQSVRNSDISGYINACGACAIGERGVLN